MKKVTSFTHRRDPDGICSGAIARRYANKNGREFEVVFGDYHTFLEDVKQLEGRTEEQIIISDMRLDGRYLPQVEPILKGLQDDDCRIDWFDHHKWDKRTESALKKLTNRLVIHSSLDPENRRCGARLVYEAFMHPDKESWILAELATSHDFTDIETHYTAALWADIIQYYIYQDREDKLVDLVSDISEGRLVTSRMYMERKEYQEKRDSTFEDLLSNAELHRIGNVLFHVSCSDPIISSTDACFKLIDKMIGDAKEFTPVIGLVVYHSEDVPKMNGKISIRRSERHYEQHGIPKDERVSCRKIAEMFGGGGRDDTAGGQTEVASPEEMKAHIVKTLIEHEDKFSNPQELPGKVKNPNTFRS